MKKGQSPQQKYWAEKKAESANIIAGLVIAYGRLNGDDGLLNVLRRKALYAVEMSLRWKMMEHSRYYRDYEAVPMDLDSLFEVARKWGSEDG